MTLINLLIFWKLLTCSAWTLISWRTGAKLILSEKRQVYSRKYTKVIMNLQHRCMLTNCGDYSIDIHICIYRYNSDLFARRALLIRGADIILAKSEYNNTLFVASLWAVIKKYRYVVSLRFPSKPAWRKWKISFHQLR